jgi:hypothetical protein
MAKRDLPLEMGNLICKFGQSNLMDYFDEVVLPAFTDSKLKRKYGKTNYFFDKVSLVTVQGRVLLAGRIIKDALLEREQVYEEGKGLVADFGEMRSSPSSVFVLILDVHRVLYVKETKFAPTLDNFKSTLEKFLKIKHLEFIDALQERKKEDEGTRVAKAVLMGEHFPPSLDVIPLTSAQDIESFVRQYEVLRSVVYKFSARNDEHDNEGFFEAVQRQKDEVGSISTEVKHANKEGLDKEHVISEVRAATAQGNQKVTLSGVDSSGVKLRGDNSSFQLKAVVSVASKLPSKIAAALYNKFDSLVGDGLIRVPAPSKSVISKLRKYRDDVDE